MLTEKYIDFLFRITPVVILFWLITAYYAIIRGFFKGIHYAREEDNPVKFIPFLSVFELLLVSLFLKLEHIIPLLIFIFYHYSAMILFFKVERTIDMTDEVLITLGVACIHGYFLVTNHHPILLYITLAIFNYVILTGFFHLVAEYGLTTHLVIINTALSGFTVTRWKVKMEGPVITIHDNFVV